MNRNKKEKQLYDNQQEIVNRLTAAMERNPGRWQQEFCFPTINGKTGLPYSGYHQLLLSSVQYERAYRDPRWYTFEEIKAHRKDGWWLSRAAGQGVLLEVFFPVNESGKQVSWNEYRQNRASGQYALGKQTVRVFNGDLISGLPATQQISQKEAISKGNGFLREFLQKAELIPGTSDTIRYSIQGDQFFVPERELTEDELGAALVQAVFATAHPGRLGRALEPEAEILVQNLAAIQLCAQLGIFPNWQNNRKDTYHLADWLRQNQEQIVRIIGQSQKAMNYAQVLSQNWDNQAVAQSKETGYTQSENQITSESKNSEEVMNHGRKSGTAHHREIRPVRGQETGVHETVAASTLRPSGGTGSAGTIPAGSGSGSSGEDLQPDRRTGQAAGSDVPAPEGKPVAVGRNHDQLQTPGQGDRLKRAGIQLNLTNLPQAEGAKEAPSASPVSGDFSTTNSFSYEDYLRIKQNNPSRIVLYQVGDFFEVYGEDAKLAAGLLSLTLTTRSVGKNERVEMCGFPNSKLLENSTQLRGHNDVIISAVAQGSDRHMEYSMPASSDGTETPSDEKERGNSENPVTLPDLSNRPVSREGDTITIGSGAPTHEIDITVSEDEYDSIQRVVPEPSPALPLQNFHITNMELGEGGAKAKFRRNMDAIHLLKELESDGRQATPEEQETLSRYVGWGGLADAFDETKDAWADEFQELKATLSPEEYSSARASTLNAHYTSPVVIRAIYDAVASMGFHSGKILEPACGVGNFFGMLPDTMSESKLYGVELDSISGRIAKQLYPLVSIKVAGFETTSYHNYFDLAVSNVPFGNYRVNDPDYNKLGFAIHNYFFAKTLDAVRPGGLIAFVTSRYTMDSKNSAARRYIAQRAEFLGAIRLPNNAFRANAGTDVVSDILFLQKREYPIVTDPEWVNLNQTEDGFTINEYFVSHPEMVLGQLTSKSTQYGREECTVIPIPGADLAQQLGQAIRHIHGAYQPVTSSPVSENQPDEIPADPNLRCYSYGIVDGQVYYRENTTMKRIQKPQATLQRMKGMVGLRDCVRELMALEMQPEATDDAIAQKQQQLNRLYDDFHRKFGVLVHKTNKAAFDGDDAYHLLASLEVVDEDGIYQGKADIFSKRTIRPHIPVTHTDTVQEALSVSLGEHGRLDLPFISELTGKPEDEATEELAAAGLIFRDIVCPEKPEEIGESYLDLSRYPYVTADEYLSGNVRQKLRMAQSLLEVVSEEQKEGVQKNVSALKPVQPQDLEASEIEVHLGATWIDASYIQQFMNETFKTPIYLLPKKWSKNGIEVQFAPITGEWFITNKSSVTRADIAAYTTYGTKRMNAYRILEDTLNLREVQVYDTIEEPDGKKKRVLNGPETTLASQKQTAIKNAFLDWIWADPERRRTLVNKYNQEINCIRPREYDGSSIVFAGMNPEIALREHQKNAVARILYGGNTMLAHVVGAGKTFTMAAAAMEGKRLGLCQKSIFVVPNHLTEQWATEFLSLYPTAHLLVTTQKDFQTQNRKQFCARIAVGDYDAVIIGHSQFEKIPLSHERQERLLEDQINQITVGIAEMEQADGVHFTIKQLEKTRRNLETKLEKLRAEQHKDSVVTFEELGCDRMFVDEAHNYKNLYFYTKMRNVAGLSATEAQKSSDLFGKCRYLDEITGSRGVIFATGTPVSNSMTELYTMQRYLQYEQLEKMGMTYFDAWASRFGEVTTAMELAPEGTGYRMRTRFSRFYNLPELMALFRQTADIKTADQLNLPVPKVEYHNVVAKPTQAQKEMIQALSKRASNVHAGLVDPSIDNMLKITSDGRKLGLDQRMINPLLPDEQGSKVNLCVGNVFRIWEESKENRLTQLVFCDISTPSGIRTIDSQKERDKGNSMTGFQNVYQDIRNKLIHRGVPADEIAFIHSAKNDIQKKELFRKVRTGKVRVLLGSTQKMGAGTNVQDRLIALHDLDCPWRPGDLEQRKGRIERQGNQNETVHIFRYVTEGTFDAYLWQTIETKQRFISQIMTSKNPVRSCMDVDEAALSYSEIKALCAGDPRIKERMDLEVDVSKLRLLRADHLNKIYRLQDRLAVYYPVQIQQNQQEIQRILTDMETANKHPLPEDGFVGMELQNTFYTNRKAAGEALLELCQKNFSSQPVSIGTYRGFTLQTYFDASDKVFLIGLKGQRSYWADLGLDAGGNLTRLNNLLDRLPKALGQSKEQLSYLQSQQADAAMEAKKPFPQEQEYQEKCGRLEELDQILKLEEAKSSSLKEEEKSEDEPIAVTVPSSVETEEDETDNDFEL